MTKLEEAEIGFYKNDKRFKYFLIGFLVYMGCLLTFLVVQSVITQSTIASNQDSNAAGSRERFSNYTDDNAKLHAQTQQYVKCIATVLLKPIGERTTVDFENCGVTPK